MWVSDDVRELLGNPALSEKECKDILRKVLQSKKTFHCIEKQILDHK